MAAEPAISGMRFWLWWLLATVVGYAVGFLAGFVFGHFLLGNVMLGIGVGAGVGGLQWLVLRRVVPRSGWWMLSTVAGLTVALVLYAVLHFISTYPFDLGWPWGVFGWAIALFVAGALIGVWQQRILREQVGRPVWWVVASAVGWGLSALGLAIPSDLWGEYRGAVIFLLFMVPPAIAGVILAAITGAALIWLLGQPAQSGERDLSSSKDERP